MEELMFELANLDNLDESVKGFYKEVKKDDGKVAYQLNATGVKSETEFTNVYNTLKKERDRANELEKQIKSFGDVTPEAYNKLKSDYTTLQESVKANSNEEFIRMADKLKNDHAALMNAQKTTYETEKAELSKQLAEAKSEIMNMRLERELELAYTQKGFPEAFPLALRVCKEELEWNDAVNQFRSKDGAFNVKEWTENVLFTKFPNLLKGNVSSGATEVSRNSNGYAQYFDRKNPNYNMTKQAELFRTNPTLARKLQEQYGK